MSNKLKFTKYNFEKVLSEKNIDLSKTAEYFIDDIDGLISEIINISLLLSDRLDVPEYIDLQEVLLDAVSGAEIDKYFLYDDEKHDTETVNSYLRVDTSFLDARLWDKLPIIRSNLKKIITDIESKSEVESEQLIRFLQQSAANYSLTGGNICSPKKYLANSPSRLPKGVTVIEIRVNSDSNARYRVFGFLIKKILYLISVSTKTSGQERADKEFDTFMELANNLIKNHKLLESVLYNITEGIINMNEFEELDIINNQTELSEYNTGWEDFFTGAILNENESSASYKKGYLDAKNTKSVEEFKSLLRDNKKELLKKLKNK